MEPTPQSILDQWYIPPDTPEQRLHYYDRAADLFHDLINDLIQISGPHKKPTLRMNPSHYFMMKKYTELCIRYK